METAEFGLEVDESRVPYAVLVVTGEVAVYTSPRVRDKLAELVSAGYDQVVADLEGVDLLDSSGLGVLVVGLRRARAHGGDLTLVCSQPNILSRLAITALTRVFTISGRSKRQPWGRHRGGRWG